MEKKEEKKPTKGKKVEKKGKRVRTGRKHESVKAQKVYSLDGSKLVRNRKPCPRCGEGTWLGKHQNRLYCGRCGYTLFEKKG